MVIVGERIVKAQIGAAVEGRRQTDKNQWKLVSYLVDRGKGGKEKEVSRTVVLKV